MKIHQCKRKEIAALRTALPVDNGYDELIEKLNLTRERPYDRVEVGWLLSVTRKYPEEFGWAASRAVKGRIEPLDLQSATSKKKLLLLEAGQDAANQKQALEQENIAHVLITAGENSSKTIEARSQSRATIATGNVHYLLRA